MVSSGLLTRLSEIFTKCLTLIGVYLIDNWDFPIFVRFLSFINFVTVLLLFATEHNTVIAQLVILKLQFDCTWIEIMMPMTK